MRNTFLILCLLVSLVAAQVTVNSVTGAASFQAKGNGDWTPLKVGAKLTQADRLKTEEEAQVDLSFSDGSIVVVYEQTELGIKELVETEKARNVKLELPVGRLTFNIQKLLNASSSFEFEMKTATAAIRGTTGEIATNGEEACASLVNGKLELITRDNKRATITGGQYLIRTKEAMRTMQKPKSPEDYRKMLRKDMRWEERKKEREQKKEDRQRKESAGPPRAEGSR